MSQLSRLRMRWATPALFVLFLASANIAVAAQDRGEASRFWNACGTATFLAVLICGALGLWRFLRRRDARAAAQRAAREQSGRDAYERQLREQQAAQALQEQQRAELRERRRRDQEAGQALQEHQRAEMRRELQAVEDERQAQRLHRDVDRAARWAVSPSTATGMPFRFCPPPGWPVGSPAWLPDRRWKPGPALPQPPPGWRLWERTVPRLRSMPLDPYEPPPNQTTHLSDLDVEGFRAAAGDAQTRLSAARRAKDVREQLQAARTSLLGESNDSYHVSGQRNRLHPLEYIYERALGDGMDAADQLQQAAESDAPDAVRGLTRAWRDLHALLDEIHDANAERLAEQTAEDDRLVGDELDSTAGVDHAWQQAEYLAPSDCGSGDTTKRRLRATEQTEASMCPARP